MPIFPAIQRNDQSFADAATPTTGQGLAATADQSFQGGLGVTAIQAGTVAAANAGDLGGGATIPQDQAVQQLKTQGYDSSMVPKDGINAGALAVIMKRQGEMQYDANVAQRANLSSTTRFITSIAGGLADPLNLVLLPFAPELPGRTALGRAAVGAAAGGAYAGGFSAAQQHLGKPLGDPDQSSLDTLKTILFGSALGGGLHAALGGKAPVINTNKPSFDLRTMQTLENTAAYAKQHGIPENEVVSKAGAIGKNQIMPATALEYGYDPKKLNRGDYNDTVANAVLTDLQKKFPNDPEAQAIGYNAGPGKAQAWLKAGRDDSILPQETQGYLKRLRQMPASSNIKLTDVPSMAVDDLPAQTRNEAGQAAVTQMLNDSETKVEPVIDFSLAENERRSATRSADEEFEKSFVQGPPPANLADAIPKPGSAFKVPDEVLDKIHKQAAAPAEPIPEPKPGQTEAGPLTTEATKSMNDAVKEAKDMSARVGEEVPVSFENAMSKHDEEIAAVADHTKAVKAAVQCGFTRGFD